MKATYDAEARAAYISFSRQRPARQVVLDDQRIVDYAADGTLVGVEILSPGTGIDLTDVPRADAVAGALAGLGFRVGLTTP